MLQQFLTVGQQIQGFMGQTGTIMGVLGVAWTVAKVVSNEKAGPVVQKVQSLVDGAAKAVGLAGQIVLVGAGILQKAADDLAELIKSNGIGGTK